LGVEDPDGKFESTPPSTIVEGCPVCWWRRMIGWKK
jgi:hypothetical protein